MTDLNQPQPVSINGFEEKDFKWEWCSSCGACIVCPKCKNNTCSGRSGCTLTDGICNICPIAQEIYQKAYKSGKVPFLKPNIPGLRGIERFT